MFVREARREGGEGWDSYGLVEPSTALHVDIGVRVVGTEFAVSDCSIRDQLVDLDFWIEGE